MARRLALLIGNQTFDNIKVFPDLRTPANDVRDFADVLKKYGGFEVLSTLVDATAEAIRQAIDDLFSEAERGDLTLLYYSGHGYKGRDARHYLIAKNSRPDRLPSTAVRETFIHDVMSISRSRHKVIILDCCFSGAFIKGRKGGVEPLLLEELKGEATAVLTSSGSIQYSYESEKEGRNSLFTQYLLEGIKTGQADENKDDHVSVSELFHYAERKVRDTRPEQTPMMSLDIREGEVFLASVPRSSITPIQKPPTPRVIYPTPEKPSVDSKKATSQESSALPDDNWEWESPERRRPRRLEEETAEIGFPIAWVLIGGLAGLLTIGLIGSGVVQMFSEPSGRTATHVIAETFTPAPVVSTQPPIPTQTTRPTATRKLVVPTEIQVGGYVQVVNTGGAGLSLRAGPGTNNARLTVADAGAILPVIGGPKEDEQGETDDTGNIRLWWYLRNTEGTEGWTMADFLAPASHQ